MARPKLGDTETERLHVKMTAAEIKEIDDFRYANRIPSRSEAVRRLCQVALLLGSEIGRLAEALEHSSGGLTELSSQAFDYWTTVGSPFHKGDFVRRDAVVEMLTSFNGQIADLEEGVDIISHVVVALYQSVGGLSKSGTFTEGMKAVDQTISEVNQTIAKLADLRKQRRENQKAISEYSYHGPSEPEEEAEK